MTHLTLCRHCGQAFEPMLWERCPRCGARPQPFAPPERCYPQRMVQGSLTDDPLLVDDPAYRR